MSYEKKDTIIHPTYTIVGNTSFPDMVSFTFKASGLRNLLNHCQSDDDLVHVASYSDKKWEINEHDNKPVCSKKHYNYFAISKHKND